MVKTTELKGEIRSKFHESNFVAHDEEGGARVYFNRNNFLKKVGKNEDGHILLKIYSAKMDELKGSDVQEFPYNSDTYNTAHPSIAQMVIESILLLTKKVE